MPTLKVRGSSYVLNWQDPTVNRQRRKVIGRVGVLSDKEAKRILRLKELELDTGKQILNVAPTARARFDRYVQEQYLPWHESEFPASHVRIAQIFRDYILPHFEDTALTQIDVKAVDDYKTSRRPKAAVGTVIKEVRALKAALNKAAEWKIIAEHPCKKAKPPKEVADEGELHFYTAEQLEKLYAHARKVHEQFEVGVCWAPFWKFAANTGLRRGEMLKALRTDIKGANLVVASSEDKRTKSGKARIIPLSPGALEAWEEIKAMEADAIHIFPRMTLVSLSRRFAVHAARAGVGGSLHSLRHTFGSHLVMKGVPLRAVQKLMGHATITTTEIYAHLAPGYMQDAIKGLTI